MHAFNYDFKSVCVCYKSPLVPALQTMRDVSAPAYYGLGSFGVFLSQAVELHLVILESLFLLCLSAKEGLSQLHPQTVVVHASAWGSVCVPGLSFLTHPCCCVHFCRYCQNQMSWALGLPGPPEKLWTVGHFQRTALMLTAISKGVMTPPS